jgi:hypothetical protein
MHRLNQYMSASRQGGLEPDLAESFDPESFDPELTTEGLVAG